MGLSDYRKKKSLSQKQLAKAIGVSESTICKYENGTISPPLDKILALSSVLGEGCLYEFKEELHLENRSLTKLSEVLHSESTNIICKKEQIDISDCPSNVFYELVVKKADYQCQICGIPAPESTNHFLELYFINISDNSDLCVQDQFVAVCPNCLKILSNTLSVDVLKKLNSLIMHNKKIRKKTK